MNLGRASSCDQLQTITSQVRSSTSLVASSADFECIADLTWSMKRIDDAVRDTQGTTHFQAFVI